VPSFPFSNGRVSRSLEPLGRSKFKAPNIAAWTWPQIDRRRFRLGTRTRRKRAQGRPLINAQTDDGKRIRAITLFDQNENAITLRMSKTRFVLIFYTYLRRVVRLISRGLCTYIIYADVACLVVSFPYKYSDGRRRTSIY